MKKNKQPPAVAERANLPQELVHRAIRLVRAEGKSSTSFIQYHLGIGYKLAHDIQEELAERGIVSQPNHVGKREVYPAEPAAPVTDAGEIVEVKGKFCRQTSDGEILQVAPGVAMSAASQPNVPGDVAMQAAREIGTTSGVTLHLLNDDASQGNVVERVAAIIQRAIDAAVAVKHEAMNKTLHFAWGKEMTELLERITQLEAAQAPVVSQSDEDENAATDIAEIISCMRKDTPVEDIALAIIPAIARHRQQAQAADKATIARLREALENVKKYTVGGMKTKGDYASGCKVAQAVACAALATADAKANESRAGE